MELTDAYEDALSRIGSATLSALSAMETVQRHLHPPDIGHLKQRCQPIKEHLDAAIGEFAKVEAPQGLEGLHDRLSEAASLGGRAFELFLEDVPPDQAIPRVLQSMHKNCQALEVLYSLNALPPISKFFLESPFHDRLENLSREPADGVQVGLMHSEGSEQPEARGGFSLYVPESYDGSRELPLVVALHGGSGSGRTFVWTWLREARGRQFILLSPTSRGPTWSMIGPDIDDESLRAMIEFVAEQWRVDRKRILLTGLSDGATYCLLCGLKENSPYTALCAVSGVFHPANASNGNLERAAGKRVYIAHGSRDWMFPVETARMTRDTLQGAGADVTFREIEDLSHTYPREENDRILSWFDPSLALPPEDDEAERQK